MIFCYCTQQNREKKREKSCLALGRIYLLGKHDNLSYKAI